jgi:hypothetical protein
MFAFISLTSVQTSWNQPGISAWTPLDAMLWSSVPEVVSDNE